LFKPLAQGKGLTLSLDTADSLPKECHGDSLRIRQILINLISNALKFTPEGGRIKITAESNKSGVRSDKHILTFRVTDTGIGIAKEQLSQLFTAFHQADATIARRFGGTGLGLAICKALVEKMGGEISVSSQPGKGTTFTFTLLLGKPEKSVRSEQKNGKPNSRVSGKRVLYIEDNRVNRLIMVEILASFGLIVTPVNDGTSAIEEIGKKPFDLVITDIFLPDMKGYELAEKIRPLMQNPCPIVALTASGTKEIREKCLRSGISRFLVKPVLPNRLIEELNGLFANTEGSVEEDAPSETVPEEKRAFPQTLSGIDCTIAEEMVSGDTEVYQSALKLFYDALPETENTVARCLSDKQFREAAAILHRTKGSSNAIGAVDFARSCEALESIVRYEAPEHYTEVFEQWKTQLRRILYSEDIKRFLNV
jgi:CheY-like chemotaxis protein/HPt (histidine-containing phosphotransfer) domain-containing protein